MKGRTLVGPCGLAVFATTLWGCQASRNPEVPGESSQSIVGGSVATTCQWPSAVMLIGPWVCSGTLVHPRAVVTAKHCVMDESETRPLPPSGVGFGESRDNWAKTAKVSHCLVHPSDDIALCLLADEVTDVPIVPVMAPCETAELGPGKPIVEVGFGLIGAGSRIHGIKKWIDGTLERRSANLMDILVTTGSQDGEYFGDSGGPLFFRMPDQTWRLIGEDCCSDDIADAGPRISTYTSVPDHVAWMEEQSGLDLTPCHDQVGWSPDATCAGFPTDPGVGTGAWATLCHDQPLARWQTCAASPYDAGPRVDLGEAGSQDADTREARPIDVAVVDSRDAELEDFDAQIVPSDAEGLLLDSRPDRHDPDALFALDASGIPDDTGITLPDASAREVGLVTLDAWAVPDLALSDARQPAGDSPLDGAGPASQSTGCSCQTGGAGSARGWTVLLLPGLLLAGLARRRRRSLHS